MIEKTPAICLRYASFSNTSRVVSWLTPQAGKVSTVIKGALRPKSPFLGQYDLFYTCELLYYSREHQGLHVARECAPLNPRPGLRTAWRATAAASYFADLISRISPPDAPHPGLFALLEAALDHLEAAGAALPLVFWVELRLLEELGLAPRLNDCLGCGRALRPEDGPVRFCYADGGLLCGGCVRQRRGEIGPPIAPDVLAMLGAWQRAESPRLPIGTRCRPSQLEELETLLGLFLRYHLELPLASRGLALEIMRLRPGMG